MLEMQMNEGPIGVQMTQMIDTFNDASRYTLFMEGSNQVLLAARRRKKSKSSNYVITLDAHSLARRSPTFCGKVRSNFVGTGFTIYDTGAKPGSRASESGDARARPSSPSKLAVGHTRGAHHVWLATR